MGGSNQELKAKDVCYNNRFQSQTGDIYFDRIDKLINN